MKPRFVVRPDGARWAVWLVGDTCFGRHGRVVESDIGTRKLARERAKKWTAQRKICEEHRP